MDWKEYRALTGWVDYDRPKLSRLTYLQKVAYFKKRLDLALLRPLRRVYGSIDKSSVDSSILIFATVTCCAIEALGKFKEGGRKKNHERFKSFLQYMHTDYRTRRIGGDQFQKLLWKYFRNGLAHGFAICHGGFEHQPAYFHVRQLNNKSVLFIDPEHFYNDFTNGVKLYFTDLRNGKPGSSIRKNFEEAFHDIFVQGN